MNVEITSTPPVEQTYDITITGLSKRAMQELAALLGPTGSSAGSWAYLLYVRLVGEIGYDNPQLVNSHGTSLHGIRWEK